LLYKQGILNHALSQREDIMRKSFCLLATVMTFILIFTPTFVGAQSSPIQIALITPIQIVSADNSISGVRLNLIYGRNLSVTGLDLGFINHTTEGLSQGVQWGIVNLVKADFIGWQDATVNWTKGDCEGFQSGFINYAKSMNGFQLGLINYAHNMKGLQIGLLNFIKQEGAFPVFPLVNWSF
jgi:hypothetical protein